MEKSGCVMNHDVVFDRWNAMLFGVAKYLMIVAVTAHSFLGMYGHCSSDVAHTLEHQKRHGNATQDLEYPHCDCDCCCDCCCIAILFGDCADRGDEGTGRESWLRDTGGAIGNDAEVTAPFYSINSCGNSLHGYGMCRCLETPIKVECVLFDTCSGKSLERYLSTVMVLSSENETILSGTFSCEMITISPSAPTVRLYLSLERFLV